MCGVGDDWIWDCDDLGGDEGGGGVECVVVGGIVGEFGD